MAWKFNQYELKTSNGGRGKKKKKCMSLLFPIVSKKKSILRSIYLALIS